MGHTILLITILGFSTIFAKELNRSPRATTTLITTSSNRDGSKEYRLQKNSVDIKGTSVSTTTTSKVTTSNQPQASKLETIPLSVVLQQPVTTTTTTVSGGSGYIEALEGYVGTGLPPTTTFVRPSGVLPALPDRFGFEQFPLYDANGVPNCGCVLRGSCTGKVGAYTMQVLKFSDIACGLQFETCCFDGPWPGSYDIFASAAACIPQEQCRRPYGVLPTDVRDFGAIAPCPGQGAVRCILVDNAGYTEFQAALAAIQAANGHHAQHTETKYEPVHLTIPILSNTGGANGGSTTSVETTSTVDVEATKDLTPVPVPVPATTVHEAPPKTVIILVAPPKAEPSSPTIITPPAPVEPVKVVQQQAPPAQVTVVASPPVDKVVQPVAVVNSGPYYGYEGYRGAYGAYPSVIGGFPGYGFGLGGGFGFRKRISISKGFGYFGK